MESLQGQLLIAAPALVDPNFAKTVVLMIEHNAEGALGLVINRPTTTTVREAWESISDDACTAEGMLHIGGPCEGVLMVVHTDPSASQIEIKSGLHFCSEREYIERVAEIAPAKAKFFIGYAGWGSGQLEGELQGGSWLVAPGKRSHVFSTDDETLWKQLLRSVDPALAILGLNPDLMPPDPSVN